ncbi:aryl-alcohol dehydrogenase-like predicted oxidoreductase [Shimia isoporae]|uniref:Aryl-alcohol dehydrogenase-like predicted oxidoreductase n=1 Tax=Shimia isoporae TaxID=647720 RepID=A0A4R1NQ03_9RHOB|nr:aldo/keto reductase [Shimia isoporae]TCL09939.1 aryl-alcohol dehydrogenase-like predicted oxidoreductase [Shimia isoporae]
MKTIPLGQSGIIVPEFCLGTMTFGTQTNESEAHKQIEMSIEAGVNFLDAAEMYPVNPITAETQGRTEEIIGNWIEKTGRRDEIIVATKHSGAGLKHIRDGAPITGDRVAEVVEGNLRRLKTDVIDLYQLHWPNRGSYMFRQNWTFDPSKQDKGATLANMVEVLEALQAQVEKGNIRAFGLSNESAWGTAQWLRVADEVGGPRVASIQNEYSLLCRMFDTDLAELSVNEDVTLLAFSPLATGLLTGKYQNGAEPQGSRKAINGNLGGRVSPRAFDAVDAYLAVANKHGLDPVHMAMAFTVQRPFSCSSIFGATTVAQLEHILAGRDLRLSDEVLTDINEAHRAHPMPY